MVRLLAFLVAMGVLIGADNARTGKLRADEKKDEKKKDDKKEEKKKEDKKEEKKEDKKEEKLSDAQKQELNKLSGTFALTTFERDGKKSSADELKKMKIVQNGADWSFHLDDNVTTGKDTPFPEKSPKEINSLYTNGPASGKTVFGIYKIEGDTITYCWAEPGKPRPKEFATKADSGLTLMVLSKVKKDDKKEEKKDNGKDEKKDAKKKDDKKKDDK